MKGGSIREPSQPDGAKPRRDAYLPAALTVLGWALSAGLLGLSGWFIASSAVAGLTPTSTFSWLFPSAGVQALAVARTVSRYGERITSHDVTLRRAATLKSRLFQRATQLDPTSVANLRSSEMLGRITVDSETVENRLIRTVLPVVAGAGAVIASVALLACLSWPLAIVGAIAFAVTGITLVSVARYQADGPARRFVSERAVARHALIETFDGLPELRSFGAETRARADINSSFAHLAASRRRLAAVVAGGQATGGLLADGAIVALVLLGTGSIGNQKLPVPVLVGMTLFAIAAFEQLVTLSGAVACGAQARAASERLAAIFSTREPHGSEIPSRVSQGGLTLRIAARDFACTLSSGDSLVVTGPSGVGKSTLLRAIAGQAESGIEAFLDCVATAAVDPHVRAEKITLVAQDAYVFDGTVRDNLDLADPAASDPARCDALTAAVLSDTVAAFPLGLATPVGPGGACLSGGQRRRLSVAQGLLRHARVLLLDEPTDALDDLTAARVLNGVRKFDPSTILVLALHDRQLPALDWIPTITVDLDARRCSESPFLPPPGPQPVHIAKLVKQLQPVSEGYR